MCTCCSRLCPRAANLDRDPAAQGRHQPGASTEFPDLGEFLWGKRFWADGYFAETVGQIEEAALRRYIQEQQRPWPEEVAEAARPPQPPKRRGNR